MLGQGTLFWGSLLGGVPNLALAAGLVGLRHAILGAARDWARWGYKLIIAGLVVPAAVDLATGSLGPPWFVPVVGIGAVMLAAAMRRNPRIAIQSRSDGFWLFSEMATMERRLLVIGVDLMISCT